MILSALPWTFFAPLKSRLEVLRQGLRQLPSPLFLLHLLVDCFFSAAVAVTAPTVANAVTVSTVTVAAVTANVTVAIAILTAVVIATTNVKSLAVAPVASAAVIVATLSAAAFC
jgi:hypothetical protein